MTCNTSTATTGGVQGWSVGEHFPLIVVYIDGYKPRRAIQYAGKPILEISSVRPGDQVAEIHRIARELAKRGICNAVNAMQWFLWDYNITLQLESKRVALEQGRLRELATDADLRNGEAPESEHDSHIPNWRYHQW